MDWLFIKSSFIISFFVDGSIATEARGFGRLGVVTVKLAQDDGTYWHYPA